MLLYNTTVSLHRSQHHVAVSALIPNPTRATHSPVVHFHRICCVSAVPFSADRQGISAKVVGRHLLDSFGPQNLLRLPEARASNC